MIPKSGLRSTINEVLGDHEVEDPDLAEDLLDRLVQDLGEEVVDDEDEGPTFLGDGED